MLKNITYISASKSGRKRQHQKISDTGRLLLLFLAGVAAGTLLINLFCSGEYDKFGIYSEYFIDRFRGFDVGKKDLFLYSFGSRGKEIVFLLVLSFTSLGSVAAQVYLLYKGLTIGILVSIYVLQYGIGGVLLYGLSIFPHYLTYVPFVVILVFFSREIYGSMRRYRAEGSVRRKEAVQMIRKTKLIVYLRCLFLIFALNAVTSYLETFVNLSIMKNIL